MTKSSKAVSISMTIEFFPTAFSPYPSLIRFYYYGSFHTFKHFTCSRFIPALLENSPMCSFHGYRTFSFSWWWFSLDFIHSLRKSTFLPSLLLLHVCLVCFSLWTFLTEAVFACLYIFLMFLLNLKYHSGNLPQKKIGKHFFCIWNKNKYIFGKSKNSTWYFLKNKIHVFKVMKKIILSTFLLPTHESLLYPQLNYFI